MFIKILVFIIMLVILISLGSGLVFLVRDQGQSKRAVKALTWRIGISLALFIFLFLAFFMGWIQPHAIAA